MQFVKYKVFNNLLDSKNGTCVNFNWILSNETDENLKRFAIELEYELRPLITRFLMVRLENECSGDFSSFHFDVDIDTRSISISDKTPIQFSRRIAKDFEREINGAYS